MEDLIEVEEDRYLLTDYTASLKLPTRHGIVGHKYGAHIVAAAHRADALRRAHRAIRANRDWLAKNGYKSPSDINDCPFQFGVAPEHIWWTWLEADKDAGERFNQTMQGMASEWKAAINLYPVHEKPIDGFKGGALIVHLGWGVGHDLEAFCEKHPVEGAEYILQDVKSVLDAAEAKKPIKKKEHDFLTERQCKVGKLSKATEAADCLAGARSFFLKQIMHDCKSLQSKSSVPFV